MRKNIPTGPDATPVESTPELVNPLQDAAAAAAAAEQKEANDVLDAAEKIINEGAPAKARIGTRGGEIAVGETKIEPIGKVVFYNFAGKKLTRNVNVYVGGKNNVILKGTSWELIPPGLRGAVPWAKEDFN